MHLANNFKPKKLIQLFLFSLVSTVLFALPAYAAPLEITVNSTEDLAGGSGIICDVDTETPGDQCTLREAIRVANTIDPATDYGDGTFYTGVQISLGAGETYNISDILDLSNPTLTSTTEIEGNGSSIINDTGVFAVRSSFSLSNVFLDSTTGGSVLVNDFYGGVYTNVAFGFDKDGLYANEGLNTGLVVNPEATSTIVNGSSFAGLALGVFDSGINTRIQNGTSFGYNSGLTLSALIVKPFEISGATSPTFYNVSVVCFETTPTISNNSTDIDLQQFSIGQYTQDCNGDFAGYPNTGLSIDGSDTLLIKTFSNIRNFATGLSLNNVTNATIQGSNFENFSSEAILINGSNPGLVIGGETFELKNSFNNMNGGDLAGTGTAIAIVDEPRYSNLISVNNYNSIEFPVEFIPSDETPTDRVPVILPNDELDADFNEGAITLNHADLNSVARDGSNLILGFGFNGIIGDYNFLLFAENENQNIDYLGQITTDHGGVSTVYSNMTIFNVEQSIFDFQINKYYLQAIKVEAGVTPTYYSSQFGCGFDPNINQDICPEGIEPPSFNTISLSDLDASILDSNSYNLSLENEVLVSNENLDFYLFKTGDGGVPTYIYNSTNANFEAVNLQDELIGDPRVINFSQPILINDETSQDINFYDRQIIFSESYTLYAIDNTGGGNYITPFRIAPTYLRLTDATYTNQVTELSNSVLNYFEVSDMSKAYNSTAAETLEVSIYNGETLHATITLTELENSGIFRGSQMITDLSSDNIQFRVNLGSTAVDTVKFKARTNDDLTAVIGADGPDLNFEMAENQEFGPIYSLKPNVALQSEVQLANQSGQPIEFNFGDIGNEGEFGPPLLNNFMTFTVNAADIFSPNIGTNNIALLYKLNKTEGLDPILDAISVSVDCQAGDCENSATYELPDGLTDNEWNLLVINQDDFATEIEGTPVTPAWNSLSTLSFRLPYVNANIEDLEDFTFDIFGVNTNIKENTLASGTFSLTAAPAPVTPTIRTSVSSGSKSSNKVEEQNENPTTPTPPVTPEAPTFPSAPENPATPDGPNNPVAPSTPSETETETDATDETPAEETQSEQETEEGAAEEQEVSPVDEGTFFENDLPNLPAGLTNNELFSRIEAIEAERGAEVYNPAIACSSRLEKGFGDVDTDKDGISDALERAFGTDTNAPDILGSAAATLAGFATCEPLTEAKYVNLIDSSIKINLKASPSFYGDSQFVIPGSVIISGNTELKRDEVCFAAKDRTDGRLEYDLGCYELDYLNSISRELDPNKIANFAFLNSKKLPDSSYLLVATAETVDDQLLYDYKNLVVDRTLPTVPLELVNFAGIESSRIKFQEEDGILKARVQEVGDKVYVVFRAPVDSIVEANWNSVLLSSAALSDSSTGLTYLEVPQWFDTNSSEQHRLTAYAYNLNDPSKISNLVVIDFTTRGITSNWWFWLVTGLAGLLLIGIIAKRYGAKRTAEIIEDALPPFQPQI